MSQATVHDRPWRLRSRRSERIPARARAASRASRACGACGGRSARSAARRGRREPLLPRCRVGNRRPCRATGRHPPGTAGTCMRAGGHACRVLTSMVFFFFFCLPHSRAGVPSADGRYTPKTRPQLVTCLKQTGPHRCTPDSLVIIL